MKRGILKNKNCLITGATGGIGREITKVLAKEGCRLFLTGKNELKLKQLKSQVVSTVNQRTQISYGSADFTKHNDLVKLISKVRKKLSHVDILVNCAGKFFIKSISESTLKDFDSCFSINVRTPFILSREFSKDMVNNGWGRIVNIGSSSSYAGFSKGTIYSASKHSILGLSRALHSELKEKNVRTICISPGSTKTEMGKLSNDQDFQTFLDPREVAEYILFITKFDNEMVLEETRLNRMFIR